MHKQAAPSGLKKALIHLAMTAIFILLALFSAWLVWLTYYRSTTQTEEALARKAIPRQEMVYESFHSDNVSRHREGMLQSLCLRCHKDYSHAKSNQTRGLLNAHSYFMACEVCHITPKEGEQFEYRWLRYGTDTPLTELIGKAGDYGGMIVPFRLENGLAKRLDVHKSANSLLNEAEAANLLPIPQGQQPIEEDTRKIKDYLNLQMHKGLSQKPLFCDKCHRENGAIDFEKLLYSPARAQRLKFGEGAAVVLQYKEFYLPKLQDERAR